MFSSSYEFKVKFFNISFRRFEIKKKIIHQLKLTIACNRSKIAIFTKLTVERTIKNMFVAIFLKHKYCLHYK